jgi:hypothetical protein
MLTHDKLSYMPVETIPKDQLDKKINFILKDVFSI